MIFNAVEFHKPGAKLETRRKELVLPDKNEILAPAAVPRLVVVRHHRFVVVQVHLLSNQDAVLFTKRGVVTRLHIH